MANVLEDDFGVTGDALCWLKSFLSGRIQRVCIDHHQSKDFNLTSGVSPRQLSGSCTVYHVRITFVFMSWKKHLPTAQSYADDTQLYLSFRPGSIESQEEAVKAMEDCIVDIKNWMADHQLMLNDSKTEFIILGSRQQLAKVNIDGVSVGSSNIKPVSSVRNLGSWFDNSMTMNIHIGKVCSKAFLRSIQHQKNPLVSYWRCHKDTYTCFLSPLIWITVIHFSMVFPNIRWIGFKESSTLLLVSPAWSLATPTSPLFFNKLHWLPVLYRVHFKVALLVFKVLRGLAPVYLTELIGVRQSDRYALRFVTADDIDCPPVRDVKTFGDRAFAVAAPKIWNSLPHSVRNSNSIDIF